MGALVGFVSEDTENFLFRLTYTQKNATAFGKMNQIYTESATKSIGISLNPPLNRREFHIIRRKTDQNFTESAAKSTRFSQNPSQNRPEFHIIRRKIDRNFTESPFRKVHFSA